MTERTSTDIAHPHVVVVDKNDGEHRSPGVRVVSQPVTERVIEMDPPEARVSRRESSLHAAQAGYGRLRVGAIAVGTLVISAALLIFAAIATAAVGALLMGDDVPAPQSWWVAAAAGAVAIFLAGLAGGWAAGRIARYAGASNAAAAVIVFAILTGLVGMAISWVATTVGATFQFEGSATFTSIDPPSAGNGWIALGVSVAILLVGALIGGSIGEHFHRRADRLIADVASAAPKDL